MKRERLQILHTVLTDAATYVVYNTQTIPEDSVNIEIERYADRKSQVILEKEIFNDSWGAMGGQAFSSLVKDAMRHLDQYISEREETKIHSI